MTFMLHWNYTFWVKIEVIMVYLYTLVYLRNYYIRNVRRPFCLWNSPCDLSFMYYQYMQICDLLPDSVNWQWGKTYHLIHEHKDDLLKTLTTPYLTPALIAHEYPYSSQGKGVWNRSCALFNSRLSTRMKGTS